MTERLGVALVGAGELGVLRAESVARSPELDLVAVADLRADAARSVAARWGGRATGDWRAAVEAPGVDLVIVATPPNHHVEPALGAVAAGRHVLCEKPLASTLADARRLCDAADDAGVILKTGFNHRHFPALRFARELVERGEIGRVHTVRAFAGHPGGEELGHAWVHDPAVTGGGCLVDNGIHVLDLVRFLLDEPLVAGRGLVGNDVWRFDGAEDNAHALFRGAAGALVSVQASWTEPRGYRFWVEATGERGFARAAYPPMRVEWGTCAALGERARRRFAVFPWFQVRERLHGWRWTIVRSFLRELAELAAGIRAGRPVPPTGRDGLAALEMAHAVYRSAREGREIELPALGERPGEEAADGG